MTDDKLRAALDAYWKEHPHWLDPDEDGCATGAAVRAALASATDEGPLPAGHPDTWPGGTMHMRAASAPDEGRDVERLEDAFSRAGALLHEEVWHIRTDELPAILAALAASVPDEGHVHEWERGVHMAAAFGVDGRTYACAICGIPRLAASTPDEGPDR